MKQFVNYSLLVKAERVRYQSDFSSAHWFHQVISAYEEGITNELRRKAYEMVIGIAIAAGIRAAVKVSEKFPPIAGFPKYFKIESSPEDKTRWASVQQHILDDFDSHCMNRFKYVREGD